MTSSNLTGHNLSLFRPFIFSWFGRTDWSAYLVWTVYVTSKRHLISSIFIYIRYIRYIIYHKITSSLTLHYHWTVQFGLDSIFSVEDRWYTLINKLRLRTSIRAHEVCIIEFVFEFIQIQQFRKLNENID